MSGPSVPLEYLEGKATVCMTHVRKPEPVEKDSFQQNLSCYEFL